jgi:hypothetical protein
VLDSSTEVLLHDQTVALYLYTYQGYGIYKLQIPQGVTKNLIYSKAE